MTSRWDSNPPTLRHWGQDFVTLYPESTCWLNYYPPQPRSYLAGKDLNLLDKRLSHIRPFPLCFRYVYRVLCKSTSLLWRQARLFIVLSAKDRSDKWESNPPKRVWKTSALTAWLLSHLRFNLYRLLTHGYHGEREPPYR